MPELEGAGSRVSAIFGFQSVNGGPGPRGFLRELLRVL